MRTEISDRPEAFFLLEIKGIMREADVQALIRVALNEVEDGMYFRANVGQGWTGNQISRRGNTVIIRNARPFNSGLPKGFSDIFGITPVLIEKKHIGQKIGVFTAIEVKLKSRLSSDQKNFLEKCSLTGSLSGVAYCEPDALNIVNRLKDDLL